MKRLAATGMVAIGIVILTRGASTEAQGPPQADEFRIKLKNRPEENALNGCQVERYPLQLVSNKSANVASWAMAPAHGGWLIASTTTYSEHPNTTIHRISLSPSATSTTIKMGDARVAHSLGIVPTKFGFAATWRDFDQKVWFQKLTPSGETDGAPIRLNERRSFDFGGPCILAHRDKTFVAWADGRGTSKTGVVMVATIDSRDRVSYTKLIASPGSIRCTLVPDRDDVSLILIDVSVDGTFDTLIIPLAKPYARRRAQLRRRPVDGTFATTVTEKGWGLVGNAWAHPAKAPTSLSFVWVDSEDEMTASGDALEAESSSAGLLAWSILQDGDVARVAAIDGTLLYMRTLCPKRTEGVQ